MRDDFRNDREEYMDLRPAPADKKFSFPLWNTQLLPVARKLIAMRDVNRLSAGFDSSKGKEYHITVWFDRSYDYGAIFTIRPVSGGVHVTCRDFKTNEFTEGKTWAFITDQIPKLTKNADLLAHIK